MHIAVDSGEGILVQFVDTGNGEGQNAYEGAPRPNNDMANINEEDEKSEYSDEQFEEDVKTVPRIALDAVQKVLAQIKLLLMIKKVPRSHMVKYLLKGEALGEADEAGEE